MLALASFVALGLPDGMLGTAWPSMRQSFAAPVGYLGLILLASTVGSVLVTVFVGALIRRLGVAPLLSVGLAIAALGAVGFAIAPVIGMVLGVALLFGLAAGMMDGGLNTAVGLSGRPRLLNLLHGAYGVGTAIGPLLVIVAVLAGSWRPAYFGLLIVDAILAVVWLAHQRGQRTATDNGDRPGDAARPRPVPGPSRGGRLVMPVAAGIAVFFVYTGLEVSAGQWETTYGRQHLHLSAAMAGLATFSYWAALTAVRIGLALLPRAPAPRRVVRYGVLLAVVAALLIWWDPVTPVTITGFILMGAALAGVFPALGE